MAPEEARGRKCSPPPPPARERGCRRLCGAGAGLAQSRCIPGLLSPFQTSALCTLSCSFTALVETALNDNSASVSPEREPLPGCRDEADCEGTEMRAHFPSMPSSYPGRTMGGQPALIVPGEEAASCTGGGHTGHREHGTLPVALQAHLWSSMQ